jgi:hypothetical protein
VDVNIDRCIALRLDPRRVASIARRLSRAARDAQVLGLTVFGASGTGVLRRVGQGSQSDVAQLDGNFDGGDGGDEY